MSANACSQTKRRGGERGWESEETNCKVAASKTSLVNHTYYTKLLENKNNAACSTNWDYSNSFAKKINERN